MFEDSLLVSAAAATPARRWTIALSFTAQALLVAALAIVPLLHPGLISPRAFDLPLAMPLTPPPVPPPPAVQPPRVRIPEITNTVMTAPTAAARIAHTTETPAGPAPNASGPITMGMSNTSPFPNSLGPPNASHIAVAPSTGTGSGTASHGPRTVSTGVSAGLLLTPIRPVYPPIAVAARMGGTVTVEAVISTAGHVESAHAIAGPILLQAAAIDAVRNARYRPFTLNGQPTEVAATFSIHFNLNGE
jgi:protein TonB